MSRIKRLCRRFWAWLSPVWRIKRLYRFLALLSGPGLFLVFGAWQALVIGRYLTDLGWHWCPTWPLAAVIGFTPFLGSLAAAKVAADVGWMGFWSATGVFLTPFWLFALLTRFPVKVGPPVRTALRLLRAPLLRRSGRQGFATGSR
jgi:hypothetical protein